MNILIVDCLAIGGLAVGGQGKPGYIATAQLAHSRAGVADSWQLS